MIEIGTGSFTSQNRKPHPEGVGENIFNNGQKRTLQPLPERHNKYTRYI